jgi:hypothetical protein
LESNKKNLLVETLATTMTLTTVKRQRKSLTQLMSQSTIYQRNELRRTKTLALVDDPRPAAVRVLSGLPGFRIFIHPYQPAVKAVVGASVAAVPAALAFSQEDVFTAHHSENDVNPDTKASSLTGIAAVGFAAGAGGAFSELLSGRSAARPFSPFSLGPTQTRAGIAAPVLHQGGAASMAFLQGRQVALPPTMIPSFQVSTSQIAARALSASFLFGTKTLVEHSLGKPINDGISPASVVSSGVAGGALGLSKILTGSRVVWGREILGATMYFTSYETVKSILHSPQSSDNNKTDQSGKIAIATAGAVAGIIYETVRRYGGTATSLRSLQPYAVPQVQRFASIALRAAPAHALLFLGYETTLSLIAPIDQHR